MELTNDEKQLLKALVEQEIKVMESDEESLLRPSAPLLALEEKYDGVLENLLKKLE